MRRICGAAWSGSGKSTLLNLLAGLDCPTSGLVVVQGSDLAKLSSEELARYRRNVVGMVFQSFHLIPSMTITENVELPMVRLRGRSRTARSTSARNCWQRAGTGGNGWNTRLGWRDTVILAGAGAGESDCPCCLEDEPTGVLHSEARTSWD